MFDWMSMETRNSLTNQTIREFCINHDITLSKTVSQEGEILNCGRETADCYRGIKTILYPDGSTKLSFSPHKLYNDLHGIVNHRGEAMNHDTFSLAKLDFIITWLYENFKVNPDETFIHQLEFGFNLSNLLVDTRTILSSLVAYKGKPFNTMSTIGIGNGREIIYPKYSKLKIYDKALQNCLPNPILRIEWKAIKMKSIKPIFPSGAILSMLHKPEYWHLCNQFLIERIDSIIFSDNFDTKNYSHSIQKRLLNWQNPQYWNKAVSYQRCRQKKAFDQFIDNYGMLKIKSVLLKAIQNEYRSMMITANK